MCRRKISFCTSELWDSDLFFVGAQKEGRATTRPLEIAFEKVRSRDLGRG